MKYIYGKRNPNYDLHMMKNSFFDLFVAIGRYRIYCQTPNVTSFEQFCENEQKELDDGHIWRAFKTGFRYMRDSVLNDGTKAYHISGIMLRRMACKYMGGRRILPKQAPEIIQMILEHLNKQSNADNVVRRIYIDFIGDCCRCNDISDKAKFESCAWNTLGFQMDMLYEGGKDKVIDAICQVYKEKSFPLKCSQYR